MKDSHNGDCEIECECGHIPAKDMKVDRVGVHASHCCKVCGCKYCDDDCPVENGQIEAMYPCQDCYERVEDLKESLSYKDKKQLEEIRDYINGLLSSKKD